MVFHGASRACMSCKKRRKKCDQTRPACIRCLKAKRTCSGYEDNELSPFRQYQSEHTKQQQAVEFKSTARRCSLPVRGPTGDRGPPEISQAQAYDFALRGFYYDFCIHSGNPKLSRGYLSGLEILAQRLGPKSDLVKACQAVSFINHGKALDRQQLMASAETFHHDLLGSFARAIENPDLAGSAEPKLVAMLLGLYQISVASPSDLGNHYAHARGLAALLGTGPSPLSLLGAIEPIQSPGRKKLQNQAKKVTSVFSVPAASSDQEESLENLILDLDTLWTRYEATWEKQDYRGLLSECVVLNQRFLKWKDSRIPESRPTVVEHIHHPRPGPDVPVGYWPGRVDTYFDLSIAGVWNISRTAQLLLLSMLVTLSYELNDGRASDVYTEAANRLVGDIIASIPYHLTDNLHAFLDDRRLNLGVIKERGKTLGGLLLIHPLYIASRVPFLPEDTRQYLKRCLLWIGSNMGVGQATLLAHAPNVSREYLASGCMIIWAGFLG